MIQSLCCLLTFLPFILLADISSAQTEVKGIEEKIQALKSQLDVNQKAEMKEEVEGQGLMIGDWSSFARDIEHVKQLEEKNKKIEQEIQHLEEQKAQLQKTPTRSTHQH